MPGRVYLVGAGPGDPGLITVRGRSLLARAEVLVYDAPCSPELLGLVRADAELVAVGRWPDGLLLAQRDLESLLVDRARKGRTVVRLKGGDPLLFGRGGEEALALAEAGVDFEIVPGVSAAEAAASFAGIPITQRGVASELVLAIVQRAATSGGESAPRDWGLDLERLARPGATRIVYLDPKDAGPLCAELLRRGLPPTTPAAVVQDASLPTQRVERATAGELAERGSAANPPAVLVLGEAVGLRERLAWFERRPLHGRGVVVTRAREQSAEMVAALEELGAEVVPLPCIAIAPPSRWEPLDRAIAGLEGFDWVVFSSVNGVQAFLERLRQSGKDTRALARARIAAVGQVTAEALAEAHLTADAVPERFDAEALARLLAEQGVERKRFLVVRAEEGRETLVEELVRSGAQVELAPAYRTVRPDLRSLEPEGDLQAPAASSNPVARVRALAREGRLDAVAFASPSAVRNFLAHFEEGEGRALLAGTVVAAIGPATAQAVEGLGLKVGVRPEEATARGLVAALASALGRG